MRAASRATEREVGVVAAERCGVRGDAMEIDPLYVEVAGARWERFSGQTAERVEDAHDPGEGPDAAEEARSGRLQTERLERQGQEARPDAGSPEAARQAARSTP